MRAPVRETPRSRSQVCDVTALRQRGPTTAGDLDNVEDVHKRPISESTPCCAFICDPSGGRGKKANYMITAVAGDGRLRRLMISGGNVLR